MSRELRQGQSFLDKVLELTGDIEQAVEMAVLNDISVTEDLVVGKEILPTQRVNQFVVSLWKNDGPATFVKEEERYKNPEGIGYWAIGVEFKVS